MLLLSNLRYRFYYFWNKYLPLQIHVFKVKVLI